MWRNVQNKIAICKSTYIWRRISIGPNFDENVILSVSWKRVHGHEAKLVGRASGIPLDLVLPLGSKFIGLKNEVCLVEKAHYVWVCLYTRRKMMPYVSHVRYGNGYKELRRGDSLNFFLNSQKSKLRASAKWAQMAVFTYKSMWKLRKYNGCPSIFER